jgi:hypothetical protein
MEAVNRVRRWREIARPKRAGAAALWLLLVFAARSTGEVTDPPESQVKAAFLLNFTKFIAWPPMAFEDPASPLSICILGEDEFGGALDQLVEGEIVNGRKVAVQRIRRAPKPKSCQVLFIGKSEKEVGRAIAEAGEGVLTVSDREGFLREGGIISFVTQGRHVRFDINQRAASKADLTLSSRLLNVARSVQK